MLLETIKKPNDIKKIESKDYNKLAEEIRQFLIHSISQTGGHLGSNLGVVELTMALHLALDLPKDKIVWDVGHQSYTHKLLTGRKEGFGNLRKYGGMSGFPKRCESECDSFDTGHSSTSISAGLGFVKARDIKGEDNYVVSVIGDGSLTGGMAYEALNNASRMDTNFIIILNDNNMSISENVGGMSKYLNSIRTAENYRNTKDGIYTSLLKTKHGQEIVNTIRKAKNSVKQLFVPGMLFENMGITYLGPVDGHDIEGLVTVINEAKRCKTAVLIHVVTKKGKGFEPAEKHPARFHGAEPFDVKTGVPKTLKRKANYTDVFSTVMIKLAKRNPEVVAITAAMPDGTGLKRFRNVYPERFFDVGIAEQHAVTFAAGLAAGGLHDVCIQNLPVVFAIDRAGLVGSDGETHQGIFDLSFLSSIPNMQIMAPKNKWELSDMMKFAVKFNGPIAVRYPRGEAYDGLEEYRTPIKYGKSEMIYLEKEIALLAVGSMVQTAEKVRNALKEKGYSCTLVNARFVKPIDEENIKELCKEHKLLVTMEENVASGGYGEKVRTFVDEAELNAEVVTVAIPDEYVEHGNVDILKKEVGIDADTIVNRVLKTYAEL